MVAHAWCACLIPSEPLRLPAPPHTLLLACAHHLPAPTCLQTNNPRKISELSQLGITVNGRIPCIVRAQEYNTGYLQARAD